MATKAQEWARKRNWAKGRMKVAQTMLYRIKVYDKILTPPEAGRVGEIVRDLEEIIGLWKTRNEMSKKNYIDSIPLLRDKK